ncbi:MAG: hypothetical protein RIR26_560 [Pseudomonadota bacterium]|jgi:small conductance mechanosensitive channel
MFLDASAVAFLTLLGLGLLALLVSVFLRGLVDRRMEMARREFDAQQPEDGRAQQEPFWLRFGEPVKRSIQSLAWTLVGLGVLNLVSYALIEIAQNVAKGRDGSTAAKVADDVERLSNYIRQGADIMVRIVLVAVVGVWVAKFFQSAMRGLLKGSVSGSTMASHPRIRARTETLLTTSGYVINAVVFVVCALMALQMLGVSVAPLLATAGVASVAIGFGAQSLVRDLLAGFFILLEDQFAVGDVVTIEGRSGAVESVTLRLTKIRLGDGSLLMIPNGEIKRIENLTSGFSQIDYRISIVFGSQVDVARELLSDELSRLARDFAHDILLPPELLGIDNIRNSTLVLRARVRTQPGQQWPLERELNRRVVERFLEAQIQLPPNANP